MPVPASLSLALAVLAAGPAPPGAPPESMYPADTIAKVLPVMPWCNEYSRLTFSTGGELELKDLVGFTAGETRMIGRWSMNGNKVHVVQPGVPKPPADLVALRDRTLGMVLGYNGEFWGQCN